MQILEHGQEHERTGVSGFWHFESADSENHAGKTVPYGDSKKYSHMGAAFYGTDGSGYEGRFSKCGICTLMKELGLYDLTSAMCHLDYAMSEAGSVTNFVRQYTLASGGSYCDCGYI